MSARRKFENAVGKMMRIILFLAVGILSPILFGYDFSGMKIIKNEKNARFSLKGSDGKWSGQVTVRPKADFPKLKVSAEPEALVIDTRELFKDFSAAPPLTLFYFNNLDQSLIVRESADGKPVAEMNRLSVELQSDIPSGMGLLFEGQTETDGRKKHFWKAKSIMLNGKLQTVTFDQVFPVNLKTIHVRIDLKKPCRLEIRKITFEKIKIEKKKIDPSVNHILNGGAERGWTGIAYNPLRNFQDAVTGKYYNYFLKREISKELQVFLDSETKYEGKYSFRLERQKGDVCPLPFGFNPVPYVIGESASMTFYAKAEKPLLLTGSFFLASGVAVGFSPVKVGTEWKKYEFRMPVWGQKGKGFTVIGDIARDSLRIAQPCISIVGSGKVWIDNVAYAIGDHAVYQEKDSFFITHKLNKDSSYYFSNEEIVAELSFRNASKKNFEGSASYEIQDVFGKTVFSKGLGTVSVPVDQSVKQSVTLQLPSELRGPFHVVFKVKSGKKVYSDVAYAGVIDRGGKLNRRIGINCYRCNNKILAEYLRDFRIGSLRIWDGYGKEWLEQCLQNAQLLKQYGFDIMLVTARSTADFRDPARWDAELELQDDLFGKYGKYLDIIESRNEANIIKGMSIELNRRDIRELAKTIRKYNLKCKLAGPTSCHTDFAWTDAILASPEGKLLDIVTEHPYRALPELPDYADDSVRMRKLIDRYKPGIPHYATESGSVQPYLPEDGFVSQYTRLAAARDIRNIIQGFTGGVERYYHFTISVVPQGAGYQVLYSGTRGNNGVSRPNPTLYALRTLSDRLEQAECVKRIKLGADYRCPVFDHGNKRTAIIWKWNEKSGTLTFKPEDAKQFTAYNFVGTKIPADKLEMNEFPIYLDTALSAEETEKAIRRGTLTSEGTSPFEVSSAILGEKRFAVQVQNRTGTALKNIEVSVETPNVVSGSAKQTIAEIGPEAKARAEFELKKAISAQDCNLKVSVQEQTSKVKKSDVLNLRAILVQKAAKPLVIDGDLSDWPKNAAVVELDRRNAFKIPKAKWGANEENIRAELRYAWDDNFLYTAVTVYKPEFHPGKNLKDIGQAWNCDSLQIAYDTLRNAIPAAGGYMDDDFEYLLAQCGGKPVVYRSKASSSVHDSLTKSIGVIGDEVGFAVKQYADRVIYEMAFPKRSVSPFNLYPYSTMRTNLIVNINNGKERAGWLELTPGIGQNPKRPDQFMDLVLLP